jgi:hypothetical protein
MPRIAAGLILMTYWRPRSQADSPSHVSGKQKGSGVSSPFQRLVRAPHECCCKSTIRSIMNGSIVIGPRPHGVTSYIVPRLLAPPMEVIP